MQHTLNCFLSRHRTTPIQEVILGKCHKQTPFSYALIEVYQQRLDSYDDNTHFDGDASLLLGGLTVWGTRSVQHQSKKCVHSHARDGRGTQ